MFFLDYFATGKLDVDQAEQVSMTWTCSTNWQRSYVPYKLCLLAISALEEPCVVLCLQFCIVFPYFTSSSFVCPSSSTH
jgi:hypothetical protein